jgi:hypothetical protein
VRLPFQEVFPVLTQLNLFFQFSHDSAYPKQNLKETQRQFITCAAESYILVSSFPGLGCGIQKMSSRRNLSLKIEKKMTTWKLNESMGVALKYGIKMRSKQKLLVPFPVSAGMVLHN